MQRLKTMLNSIDHKGYPAYKGLKGSYDFGDYRLGIDKVQGDPFASPSRISLVVPQNTHAIPKEFYEQKHRRIAVEDHLLRLVCRESEPFNFKAKGSGWFSGKWEKYQCKRTGQNIFSIYTGDRASRLLLCEY